MGTKHKLRNRYKRLKKKIKALESKTGLPREKTRLAEKERPQKDDRQDKIRVIDIKERQLIGFFIHVLQVLGGKAEYEEAKEEYKSSIPFSEEFKNRTYQKGQHIDKSVFDHHFSFLRGQASREKSRELGLLRTEDDPERDKYFELTDYGHEYARANKDFIQFVIETFNKLGIKVAVKRGS